ncbi:MAG: DUF4256 domain-containing protein [Oscillospiraceae bacterium]|nr:DUF4256 domain-containing protein [Oscillospiraceae bacterium]
MLEILKNRFLNNMTRHPDIEWEYVENRLMNVPDALETLERMERSGGEPDTIGFADGCEELVFCDCSPETPAARRSLCYDDEALRKRTKNPPAGSALNQAEQMGIALMTEKLYRRLQETGPYDLKTSSWIATPDRIRELGGALFCERRYDTVFTFHNGADSYYSVRGWRGYFIV